MLGSGTGSSSGLPLQRARSSHTHALCMRRSGQTAAPAHTMDVLDAMTAGSGPV